MIQKLLLACLACIFITISSPIYAEDEHPCDFIERVAGDIMAKRQAGVPVSTMINILKKSDNEYFIAFMSEIIIDAYRVPLLYTNEFKEKIILEFKNKWYLKCYGGLND